MSFMAPQITILTDWYEIDGANGTAWVEVEVVGADLYDWCCASGRDPARPEPEIEQFYEGVIYSVTRVSGYGARLSAPGYLDCTEWAVFDSEAEAAEYLLGAYYDSPDDEMTDDEREEREWLESVANPQAKAAE